MSRMSWPKETWTQTRLDEENYKLEFSKHCETCDEDVDVYAKWDYGKKSYVGIISGTQEQHQCRI